MTATLTAPQIVALHDQAMELTKDGKTIAEILEAMTPEITAEFLAGVFGIYNLKADPYTYLAADEDEAMRAVEEQDVIAMYSCSACAVGSAVVGLMGGPANVFRHAWEQDRYFEASREDEDIVSPDLNFFHELHRLTGKPLAWISSLETGYMNPGVDPDETAIDWVDARVGSNWVEETFGERGDVDDWKAGFAVGKQLRALVGP